MSSVSALEPNPDDQQAAAPADDSTAVVDAPVEVATNATAPQPEEQPASDVLAVPESEGQATADTQATDTAPEAAPPASNADAPVSAAPATPEPEPTPAAPSDPPTDWEATAHRLYQDLLAEKELSAGLQQRLEAAEQGRQSALEQLRLALDAVKDPVEEFLEHMAARVEARLHR